MLLFRTRGVPGINNLSDPSESGVEMLKKHIPPGGTVIAWYKHFEKMVCKQK